MPGEYYIKAIFTKVLRTTRNTTTVNGVSYSYNSIDGYTFGVKIPDELLFLIELKPGTITYIGDFYCSESSFYIFYPDLDISFNSDVDTFIKDVIENYHMTESFQFVNATEN
jgi:hypothetical protein